MQLAANYKLWIKGRKESSAIDFLQYLLYLRVSAGIFLR